MYSLLLLLFLGNMQPHLMHKISLMKRQEWEGILAFLCLFAEQANNFFAPSQAVHEPRAIETALKLLPVEGRSSGERRT